MTTVQSRIAYLDVGLEVLADLGYAGLKLAEVCRRLGVTSGSFYHYFDKWPTYTEELIEHWRDTRTVNQIERLDTMPDPHQRLLAIVDVGLSLPHRAESAIRTWSKMDSRVHAVQDDVDRQRFDTVTQAAFDVTGNRSTAEQFAHWALYLLIGFEQSTLPTDVDALRAAMLRLMESISDRKVTDHVGEHSRSTAG